MTQFNLMHGQVYKLRVELDHCAPMVWRRIEVPSSASFWDLHCAIQDAFGWRDSHLHQFEVNGIRIGIPDDQDMDVLHPSWEVGLDAHLSRSRTLTYVYDFGDWWAHTLHVEGQHVGEGAYPRCLAGENACPPEDCGGEAGFEALKITLTKPTSAKCRQLRKWLEGFEPPYWPYDPAAFDVQGVQFTDATLRLKRLHKDRL